MERNIEVLIRDLAVRSTGDESAVRYEDFGERQCLESDSFQEIPLGQDWLIRSATEEEACTLLTSFVSGALDVGPGLGCELTRLLAEKGSVVKEQLQKVIEGTDWSRYGTPCRVLAGLHFLPDGKQKTMELLNIIPEDWRDGLLASIWKSNDIEMNLALLRKFEEWIQFPDWRTSSGEDGWVDKFIAKWVANEVFPYARLENLITWHFKREFRHL